MSDAADKRTFSRSNSHQMVRLTGTDDNTSTGDLCDVSMNGLFADFGGAVIPEGEARVEIMLEMGGENDIALKIKGLIRRSDSQGTAIEFLEIDAEDLEHLKKLVLYNSADPDRLVEELGVNTGIRPAS